jgi:hypothetical protein
MSIKTRIARLESRFRALAAINRGRAGPDLESLGWAIQRVRSRSYRPIERDEDPELEALADQIIRCHRTVMTHDPHTQAIGLTGEWANILDAMGLDPTAESLLSELA